MITQSMYTVSWSSEPYDSDGESAERTRHEALGRRRIKATNNN